MTLLSDRNHTNDINSYKKHGKVSRGQLFKSMLSDAKWRYCRSGIFAQQFENLFKFTQYPTVIHETLYTDNADIPSRNLLKYLE